MKIAIFYKKSPTDYQNYPYFANKLRFIYKTHRFLQIIHKFSSEIAVFCSETCVFYQNQLFSEEK